MPLFDAAATTDGSKDTRPPRQQRQLTIAPQQKMHEQSSYLRHHQAVRLASSASRGTTPASIHNDSVLSAGCQQTSSRMQY